MKTIVTSLLLATSISLLAQSEGGCSQIFISEVLVGEYDNADALVDTDSAWSYAIEIYNPTENDINLSEFSIQLVDESGNKDTFQLSDSISSHETYVLANEDCHDSVSSRAEKLIPNFSFDGYVALELYGGSRRITQIGDTGIFDPDVISIDSLYNDPSFLAEINIDLSSISNISARRYAFISTTYPDFNKDTFKSKWYFVPDELYTHLGVYHSSCASPVIHWRLNQNSPEGGAYHVDFEFNYYIQQKEYVVCDGYNNLTKDITVTITDLDGGMSNDANGNTSANCKEYPDPAKNDDYIRASDFFDFETWYPFTFHSGWGGTQHKVLKNLCYICDDDEPEYSEETLFRVHVADANGTGAQAVSPTEFKLTINDNDANGIDDYLQLKKNIKILPTVFRNTTRLHLEDPSVSINSIKFIDSKGQVIYKQNFSSSFYSKIIPIRLNQTAASGIGYFFIKTDKGTITKKAVVVK